MNLGQLRLIMATNLEPLISRCAFKGENHKDQTSDWSQVNIKAGMTFPADAGEVAYYV